MPEPLDAVAMSPEDRRIADAVAERAHDIIDLASALIRFDTTTREAPDEPAREDRALQEHLAERLAGGGAAVDLWEPAAADVAGHPLVGPEGLGFAGRPQLAARFAGEGGGRSLLFNGHVDVVPAAREDGWASDPFAPAVRDGMLFGRGACDMKGGIAAMVVAAEVLAAEAGLRGDLLVCTNTDEESSGAGALACARRGVAAGAAIVPEPTSLEIWPACRGSVYAHITVPGRAGHAEQEHPDWTAGGAVNAVEKARHVLDGIDRLRADWRARPSAEHPLLSPPDLVVSRLVADGGWAVTLPQTAALTLAALVLPAQADADGWLDGVEREIETFLLDWCRSDSWLAAHPPSFRFETQVNPAETPVDADVVRALAGANGALGLPAVLGALGSWYDGATFALEAGTPAVMYGPRGFDWAHAVDERVPVADLVACAQGLAIAARRFCS